MKRIGYLLRNGRLQCAKCCTRVLQAGVTMSSCGVRHEGALLWSADGEGKITCTKYPGRSNGSLWNLGKTTCGGVGLGNARNGSAPGRRRLGSGHTGLAPQPRPQPRGPSKLPRNCSTTTIARRPKRRPAVPRGTHQWSTSHRPEVRGACTGGKWWYFVQCWNSCGERSWQGAFSLGSQSLTT